MADATDGPAADGHQWVKVSFYAQIPRGQVILDVDPLETAAALMRAFGYTTITGLVVAVARNPTDD